jgi:tRNA pseudouridine55 synthase
MSVIVRKVSQQNLLPNMIEKSFLKGRKGYIAEGEFGFETTTLDMAGNVTKNEKFDHITRENVEAVIPHFTGKFLQDPPIYSAIHKEGKRLHELARMGMTAEDVNIEPRAVEVYDLQLLNFSLPKFEIQVTSASGLYVRSLIRDIGYSVDSVATTTKLQRIKQGPFTIKSTLPREDWTVEKMNEVMEEFNSKIVQEDEQTESIQQVE